MALALRKSSCRATNTAFSDGAVGGQRSEASATQNYDAGSFLIRISTHNAIIRTDNSQVDSTCWLSPIKRISQSRKTLLLLFFIMLHLLSDQAKPTTSCRWWEKMIVKIRIFAPYLRFQKWYNTMIPKIVQCIIRYFRICIFRTV